MRTNTLLFTCYYLLELLERGGCAALVNKNGGKSQLRHFTVGS